MQAAVLHTPGDDALDVREVNTSSFGPGRVRIRMHRASLCHSDLSVMNGMYPHPAPFVAGHEGAGEVLEVGAGVDHLQPGDKVIVCWSPPCDECAYCTSGASFLCMSASRNVAVPNFAIDDTRVAGMFGGGTFAEEVVVGASAAVPIPADVPYDIAALVGCGVTTGVGAVLNTAQVKEGSTVVVVGLGGVGISIVQAARVAGARQIVAVDPVAQRLAWAMQLGATQAVAPEDLTNVRDAATNGIGFDYAFEAVGKSATLRAAYQAARRGGTVCLVGVGSAADEFSLTMGDLARDQKRLVPSYFGGDDVRRTFDTVIGLWRAGRLDLASMITDHVPLTDVNTAITRMRTGQSLRTVIDITPSAVG